MIGKSVSNAVLDGWTGAFYEWEGDVKVRVGGAAEVRPELPLLVMPILQEQPV